MVACIALFLALFPSISREAQEFQQLIEGFPEPVRMALGLAIADIGSILGYYSYVFLYISLLGALQAMILGVSIISRETREKTADFLLTKPVARKEIITSKIIASFISLVVTNFCYLGAAVLMSLLVVEGEFSLNKYVLISLTLFFLQLIFLSLGVILAVIIPRIRSVFSLSLGVVFSFFLIGALASTSGDQALRYLTPFKYFDPAYIIAHSGYEMSYLIAALVIIVSALTGSYLIYQRKDIPAL